MTGDDEMPNNSEMEQQPPELIKELAEELQPTFELIQIPLKIESKKAYLFYIKTVVDPEKLQQMILKPFYEMSSQEHFETYIHLHPDVTEIPSKEELLVLITRGFILIEINGKFILLDFKKVNSDTVLTTALESTLHGPQLAYSEDLETNLNILRQRYHTPDLAIEAMELQDRSRRAIAIVYDKKAVNRKVLKLVQDKINKLDQPLVQSSGDLALYLTDKKFQLFPESMLTDRPDRTIYNLTGGKVIILVNGSPHAILMPIVFFDFMIAMENNYHTYWVSIFGTILAYFSLLTCLFLPSIYVAVTSYSPEIMRTELALTIAGSRMGVPYPSYIEVLFMLIFMELLTEASLRLPKSISATATTVGGLILGTAATEAALASNIMIIVVAAVAIATFVIPINELSFALRVTRIILILFTSIFGIVGLILGSLFILMYLINKDSYGEPFLRFAGLGKEAEKKVRN